VESPVRSGLFALRERSTPSVHMYMRRPRAIISANRILPVTRAPRYLPLSRPAAESRARIGGKFEERWIALP
jgi:hypothetical protein